MPVWVILGYDYNDYGMKFMKSIVHISKCDVSAKLLTLVPHDKNSKLVDADLTRMSSRYKYGE
jgi:hypothetical protein